MRISFGTAINYINLAKAAGLGWPLPEAMTEAALEALLFPPKQSKAKGRDVPDWGHIRTELARMGVTLSLLWKEYNDGAKGAFAYSRWWKEAQLTNVVLRRRPLKRPNLAAPYGFL